MPPELSDEHVAAICRVLIDHGVQFVVIGGMAARLHDTGHATVDLDICPSTDDANLARLASALSDLGARLRVSGDPEGVPFEPHADLLRQVELMTLITEHGPLDLCFIPDGFPDGYATLSRARLGHRDRRRRRAGSLPGRCRRIEAGGRTPEGHRCASAP